METANNVVSICCNVGRSDCNVLIPVGPSSAIIVAILFVTILTFFHMNYAMAWTMMSEGAVPVEYCGTAAGLICTAGSYSETFISVFAGNLIDNHPGITGYRYFFIFFKCGNKIGININFNLETVFKTC